MCSASLRIRIPFPGWSGLFIIRVEGREFYQPRPRGAFPCAQILFWCEAGSVLCRIVLWECFWGAILTQFPAQPRSIQ